MRALIIAAVAAVAFANPALAGPVTLKSNPVDSDGRVTLGDLFDNAGGASEVVVGQRVGPSIVFEARQLQSMARQSGLDWANPSGLRRVVVRNAAFAPATGDAEADAAGPAATRPARPAARNAYADRIISRNDIVQVAYEVGGVRLTISGRAEGNAAEGERLAVRNLQSNRVIDAVALAPGQAAAGPSTRLSPQQLAAR